MARVIQFDISLIWQLLAGLEDNLEAFGQFSLFPWGKAMARHLRSARADSNALSRQLLMKTLPVGGELLARNSRFLGGRSLDDLESQLGSFPLELLDL
jgi:hypothetical protein